MNFGPWRSLPPEGSEFYCWYHEPTWCEPKLYYIGLAGADERGAWLNRDELPVLVLGMPGLWRHPAVPIPLDYPRPKRTGQLKLDAELYRPRGGHCAVCGEELCPYETKALHPDGRMACGRCVFAPGNPHGEGWLGWSDG